MIKKFKKPKRLWAADGNAFQCEECEELTPRTVDDVMGEKERHKSTCSAFDPTSFNFEVTLKFHTRQDLKAYISNNKTEIDFKIII